MKIRTKIDKHKSLIYMIIRLIHYEPFGEKFEDTYNKFLQVLLSNIPENRNDLLLLFSNDIDKYNDEMSVHLNSATEKERAFYNAGRFRGLCDLIKRLGDYNEYLKMYLKPFLELNVGDIVYIKNGDITYKTTVVKRSNNKIQVKYGNRWYTQDDYLERIFPSYEEDNLRKCNMLDNYSNCDKCAGFKQGKCAYGYSVSTYYGFTYRFDNTKYRVLKGRPKEPCCKNVS